MEIAWKLNGMEAGLRAAMGANDAGRCAAGSQGSIRTRHRVGRAGVSLLCIYFPEFFFKWRKIGQGQVYIDPRLIDAHWRHNRGAQQRHGDLGPWQGGNGGRASA